MTMGIIGIIIAVALFMILVYKGWKNYYVAPICVVIVAVFNQMNPVEQFNTNYITGVVDMIVICFTVIFLGTILGRVYADTGAAQSIASFMTRNIVDRAKGHRRVLAGVLAYYVITVLMQFGGIDGYCVFFTTLPVVVIICQKCGIPKRFIPGLFYVMAGVSALPGVPGIFNIMPQSAMASVGIEWSYNSVLVPSIVGYIICAVLCIGTLNFMIKRAIAKGEVFEYGELEHYSIDDGRKLPNVIVAILPIILVFVLFSVVKLDILVSLTAGILLALILMGRYMEAPSTMKGFVGAIKETLNSGSSQFPDAIFSVSIASGLATVITSTAAFGAIVAAVAGIHIHPNILTLIVVMIIVAITSSPPVAMLVGIPMVVGILQQQGVDFNPAAIGRIAAFAALTFETLPINGAVLLTLSISKNTHKDSYLPLFLESVAWTSVATVVIAVMCIAFPGLA